MSKISNEQYRKLNDWISFDANKNEFIYDRLNNVLIRHGKELLHPKYRNQFDPSNPTKNHCYVVSEWVYWYRLKEYHLRIEEVNGKKYPRVQSWCIKSPDDPFINHWFVTYRHYHGFEYVADLTVNQFDNFDKLDYSKAKPRMFLQTACTGPSKRAKRLAELMGYHPEEWNDYANLEVHLALKGAGLI